MQAALAALSAAHARTAVAHQPWWREGAEVCGMRFLADDTWEVGVRYAGASYVATYDAATGRCDDVEPVDALGGGWVPVR